MTPRDCTDCGTLLTDEGLGLASSVVCVTGLWHRSELTRWEKFMVKCYGFRLPRIEFRVIGWDGYVIERKKKT